MGWNNNVKRTCNGKIARRRGLIALSLIRIFLIGWRRTDDKENSVTPYPNLVAICLSLCHMADQAQEKPAGVPQPSNSLDSRY